MMDKDGVWRVSGPWEPVKPLMHKYIKVDGFIKNMKPPTFGFKSKGRGKQKSLPKDQFFYEDANFNEYITII
ncbi:MAG: hypothetical protein PF482_07510 [Desulfobacteraceae bacterium]|jgi:hypothetical protein|nr:hypothetical protein [Desulfobacteraceae bacterium]